MTEAPFTFAVAVTFVAVPAMVAGIVDAEEFERMLEPALFSATTLN
jgi:hypothetical protein